VKKSLEDETTSSCCVACEVDVTACALAGEHDYCNADSIIIIGLEFVKLDPNRAM
jgi:hypothetical protein